MVLVLIAWPALQAQTYTAYRIDTFAGGGLPVNEPGTSASLNGFISLAVDSQGNVYFVHRQTILQLSVNGMLRVVAGNGVFGSGGDGGLATQAQIGYQSSIAVDRAGNVYLADWSQSRVREIFTDGIISTVAGGGTAVQDGVPATQALLEGIGGVAVDPQDNFYISVNNAIRKISNGVITTIAGTGIAGFSGDGGPAIDAQFAGPCALALDSDGNLYVADIGNNRVREISGGIVTTVAGTGVIGYGAPDGDGGPATSANLNMSLLSGIATDSAGKLYLSSNEAVREVSNGIITTVAGVGPAGSNGYTGDGGPATEAKLSLPAGIAVDVFGNLYIGSTGYGADDARIRKVSNGIITTAAGGGFALGDGGPAVGAQLGSPCGLTLDASGNLFIADAGDDRVRRVSNGTITTVAGTGTSLFGDSGDGGPAIDAALSGPCGVVVDSSGDLFISDGSSTIREVVNGVIHTVPDQGPQGQLLHHDVNNFVRAADGTIYTSDLFDNVIYKLSNGVVTTFAGTGAQGYSGDNGPAAQAEMNKPGGLVLSADGDLYFADTGNGAIRRISNGIISTVATGLESPFRLAIDAAGVIYVSDGWLIRTVVGGSVATIAGGGTSFGDGGPATEAELFEPDGIVVDAAGRVYVADSSNSRVRVLTPYQSPCTFSVDQSAFLLGTSASAVTLSVQTEPGCSWSVTGLPSWISGPAKSITGTSEITFGVAANTGAARVGTFSISGAFVSIGQSAADPSSPQLASAASSATGPFAPSSLVSLYGTNFTASFVAAALPLPTGLDGVSVSIHDAASVDLAAPLLYASPGQINFEIPDNTALGVGILTVTTSAGVLMTTPIQIVSVAPAVFALNSASLAAATIIRVHADGTQSFDSVFSTDTGAVLANPIDLGSATDRVYLSVYGTGFRNAGTSGVTASIAGNDAWVAWAGPQGVFPGLDQCNILLPRTLAGSGTVFLGLTAGGLQSNTVTLVFQ